MSLSSPPFSQKKSAFINQQTIEIIEIPIYTNSSSF